MGILDDLYTVIEQAKPIQYYATQDGVTRGKCFMIKSDGFSPEYIIFHPDDFAEQRGELARYCRLVHIRDWQPTKEEKDQAWHEVIEWANERQRQ